MSATIEDFYRFLDAQREDFRRSLGARVGEIDSLWTRMSKGFTVPRGMDRLERLAHALAGSSGTFGFTDVGAAARKLELAVQQGEPAGIQAAVNNLKRKLPQ